MVITYKQFHTLRFPIFMLHSETWEIVDGLFFCDGKLVDDTNMTGDSLGARRIQTPFSKLFPLKKAVMAPNGLLKQKTKYFVDSNGMPFIYEKTKFMSLKYLKIQKVTLKDTASLLTIKGIRTPFTVPRPPAYGYDWAGILHVQDLPWMLYEYAETKLKDTKRKV